jgi:hypothetical protein
MAQNEQFRNLAKDPILDQAEKIFSQRQARSLVVDRDILGEPGWDILLYAFIAQRRGLICEVSDLSSELKMSFPTTKRWVDFLTQRGYLMQKEKFFSICDDIELKMSKMFDIQVKFDRFQ